MDEFERTVKAARDGHVRALDAFLERHAGDLDRLARWCARCAAAGGKVLFFGNGGSAADAQHMAAELVNRLDRDRPGIAAVALTTDSSAITSIANDRDFARVFARQIEALGRPGDVAIGITTSGDSPNVAAALAEAHEAGLRTAVITGRDGGRCAASAELAIIVPAQETSRIQEVHAVAGHLLCARIEELLFPGSGGAGTT